MLGNGGRLMIDFINKRGLLLNSNIDGDLEEEYTYIDARGSMVIDYVIVNDNA